MRSRAAKWSVYRLLTVSRAWERFCEFQSSTANLKRDVEEYLFPSCLSSWGDWKLERVERVRLERGWNESDPVLTSSSYLPLRSTSAVHHLLSILPPIFLLSCRPAGSVFACLPVCIYVCVSAFLHVCLCAFLCICWCICLSTCLCLSIRLYVSLSILAHSHVCLSVSLSICFYAFPFIRLSVCISACVFIRRISSRSVCMPAFICLSVCPSAYLSTWPMILVWRRTGRKLSHRFCFDWEPLKLFLHRLRFPTDAHQDPTLWLRRSMPSIPCLHSPPSPFLLPPLHLLFFPPTPLSSVLPHSTTSSSFPLLWAATPSFTSSCFSSVPQSYLFLLLRSPSYCLFSSYSSNSSSLSASTFYCCMFSSFHFPSPSFIKYSSPPPLHVLFNLPSSFLLPLPRSVHPSHPHSFPLFLSISAILHLLLFQFSSPRLAHPPPGTLRPALDHSVSIPSPNLFLPGFLSFSSFSISFFSSSSSTSSPSIFIVSLLLVLASNVVSVWQIFESCWI